MDNKIDKELETRAEAYAADRLKDLRSYAVATKMVGWQHIVESMTLANDRAKALSKGEE